MNTFQKYYTPAHRVDWIAFLSEVFGRWDKRKGWVPAQISADAVDTSQLPAVIQQMCNDRYGLNSRQYIAILMRFDSGCRYKGIGTALGVSLQSARQIVHAALWKIRRPYNLYRIRRAVPGWFNIHRP